VHLVGVYEGFEETNGKPHGPKALVHVDRPGKQVTLVLTSYDGATWQITATETTQIQRVILGGYKQQAVKGIPESAEIVKAWRGASKNQLDYAYEPVGQQFRRLVKQTFAITQTPLSSFHGSYRPEADSPIVIDKVQVDPLLSEEYPPVTPPGELPEDARKVEFFSLLMQPGGSSFNPNVSWGRFTPAGPDERSFNRFPNACTVSPSILSARCTMAFCTIRSLSWTRSSRRCDSLSLTSTCRNSVGPTKSPLS
jgi:hypothetical protein